MEITYVLKLTAGLLAILNPLGALSIFVTLTQDRTEIERRRIARVAALTVAAALLTAMAGGDLLLSFFGISLGSFRVGGGILILLMAIAMLHARQSGTKHTREESLEAQTRQDIAVVPLGIPLLAGPGSISTVILYRADAHVWWQFVILVGVIAAVSIGILLILYSSTRLVQRFGKTGINVIARVMGLILAAIAVEFIADGLKELFPALVGT